MLCTLGLFFHTLHCDLVFAETNTAFFLKMRENVVDDGTVKVLSTKEGISVGCLYLKDSIVQFQDGYIEGSTTKVENGDSLLFCFSQPVGKRRGRRLVDNSFDIQARDATRIFCRLSLGIIKVCGNRYDRFVNVLSKIVFRYFLDLCEYDGTDVGGSIAFVVDLDPRIAVIGRNDVVRNKGTGSTAATGLTPSGAITPSKSGVPSII